MRPESPVTIHLKDYAPTPFVLRHVDLAVALDAKTTRIESRMMFKRRSSAPANLVLDGEGLVLESIAIDGVKLAPQAYDYSHSKLTISTLPEKEFELTIIQYCNPQDNTALSGLYLSNGMYCTQMEAEGFRRFAFAYDRPDVMATYQVRIEAPKSLPVLLSNGNPVEQGDMPGTDRHFAVWNDPHPKPTYLFALVGGDLASAHGTFTTGEGRDVALGIYVEKGKEDRCGWALEALKASMLWDEKRFGRYYDLDVFNIVAVSDFNMGAMENKGLNIFNDKYILARPDTATDSDYINIERIIAHEYFHNWTGNRITCRDWFQLCLKEGLTVFRDQEFTSDVRSRPVKRIDDVKTLRARQFPEDQGPLAHPVRPQSYIEINNFYTPTVYEKGAEICRMMHTLIGPEAFRRAMDLYFARHDGDAATVEDFVACMAEASGRDLEQFASWYAHAGTPVVRAATAYDSKAQKFTLTLEQSIPTGPGAEAKPALHIPLSLGLVSSTGEDMPLVLEGKGVLNAPLIELTERQQTFRFSHVAERPRLSINRGFTAPIILQADAAQDDLLFLMGHDSDSFNRWEAAQTVAKSLLTQAVAAVAANAAHPATDSFAAAVSSTLQDATQDNAFKAFMLQLPGEAEIAATIGKDVNAAQVRMAREAVRKSLSLTLSSTLESIIDGTAETGPYVPDTAGTARRSLRYAALAMLAAANPEKALAIAAHDFASASSMTAEMGALSAIITIEDARADALLESFHARHSQDHLLVDKWFMLQAQRTVGNAALHVEALTRHHDFRYSTPNRVYALIGGFTGGNIAGFHAADGEGYRVLADAILILNGINPQVAARMATAFRSWRQYDEARRGHAQLQMQRILSENALSRDVYEIISRTLSG